MVATLGTEPAKLILSVAGEDHPQATLRATLTTLEGFGFQAVGAVPPLQFILDRRGIPKVPLWDLCGDGTATSPGQFVRRIEVAGIRLGVVAWSEWPETRLREEPESERVSALGERFAWGGREHAHRWIHALANGAGDLADLDLVVALPHWDLPHRHYPLQETRHLAVELATNGVHLIAGQQWGSVQPLELLGDPQAPTVCLYNAGPAERKIPDLEKNEATGETVLRETGEAMPLRVLLEVEPGPPGGGVPVAGYALRPAVRRGAGLGLLAGCD